VASHQTDVVSANRFNGTLDSAQIEAVVVDTKDARLDEGNTVAHQPDRTQFRGVESMCATHAASNHAQ
jgi:hypothetical protein